MMAFGMGVSLRGFDIYDEFGDVILSDFLSKLLILNQQGASVLAFLFASVFIVILSKYTTHFQIHCGAATMLL